MNKKKQNSTQKQDYTNSYGFMDAPINAQGQKLLNAANTPTQVDPSIQGRFGEMENDLVNSYNDPLGSYTTQAVREKSLRSNKMKLGVQKDKAMREGYNEAQGADWMKTNAAAAFTAPQLVSTGGSSSGVSNTTQSGGFWAQILPSIFSGAGSAAG